MKLVEAFVHHARVDAIVKALTDARFRMVAVHGVRGTLTAVSDAEHDYTVGSGRIITESHVVVVCAEVELKRAVELIKRAARVGFGVSGWIVVTTLEAAMPIGGPDGVA